MAEDIFEDWRNKRFVIVDTTIYRDADYPILMVVLADIAFWTSHFEELYEWCKAYGGRQIGMTIEFDTHEQLSLFCLKWS